MEVRRVIKRAPVTISQESTILDAMALMAEERIGALIVLERGRLVGIVSERDLVCSVAEGSDLDQSLHDVVTLEPWSVQVDATVGDAARIMSDKGIRHLLVVAGEDALQGMVSIRDLLAAVLRERSEEVQDEYVDFLVPLLVDGGAGSPDAPNGDD